MGGEVVASREPPHPRALLLQEGDSVRAEAANIVGRHERNGPDVERTLARSGDLDPSVVVISSGGELQRGLRIGRAQARNRNHLPVRGTGAPHETDSHLGAPIARKHGPPRVRFPHAQRQAGLLNASRRVSRQPDQGRVLADVWIPAVHRHRLIRADGTPPGRSPAAATAAAAATGPLLGGVELIWL